MDSIYFKTIWIIASALSGVRVLVNGVFTKTEINFLVAKLTLGNHDRSSSDLILRFKDIKENYIYKNISFTSLQTKTLNVSTIFKSSNYTKFLEKLIFINSINLMEL